MNKKMSLGGICFVVHEKPEYEKAVLCIHGHGGDHRGLEPLAESLRATVYSIDLPGFGESKPLKEHSMEAMTTALQQFITERGLSSFAAVGHSLGSAIALSLAANDDRVSELVLINPVPTFSKLIKKLLLTLNNVTLKIPEPYAHRLVHAHIYNLAAFLLLSRQRRDTEHRKAYLKQQADASYSLEAWRESGEAIFLFNHFKTASNIEIPTLILHGDEDAMTPLKATESFKTHFKNAQLINFEKVGHFMHIEHTKEVAEAINGFMEAKK